jgi:hypothetical protein
VTVLQRELGVEPELETKQLYQEILRQRATASGPTAGPAASATARPLARAGLDTQPAETPLVGRDAPVAQVHAALHQAEAGSGQLLAILGETGIGKSRLVEELVTHAAQDNCRILLGRAYESDQILLFGPFVDAFRADELARDAAVIQALGPAWRAELSALLPRFATPPGAPRLPEQVDYRRLFECIAQLLQQLSAREPLLLVLEDLHWADELSLRLLAFLGRRVQTERILVALTAREEELTDNPMLRRTLQDLSQQQQMSSVHLCALSQPETAALVGLLAPAGKATAIESLGQQVWVATEGNPFMIVETMRGLQDDRSSLPEPLRWDAERPVEARGRVLPRDDHRQLRDGVVVVVVLHAREQLVVDVAARIRDRVGVFEGYLLRVAEERALRVVVERLELLRRDAEPAAHGSIGVLSELAAVPPGDATVEQPPERTGHALRVLLEGGPHPLRGAEIRRVARVKEVRMERRAPELALFLEHFAQVVRERLDVDRRDARFPLQHGHLLHVRLCGRATPGQEQAMRREISRPAVALRQPRFAQPLSYSSWRRHQTPVSLRPLGARSSHWYMPQRPSTPRE